MKICTVIRCKCGKEYKNTTEIGKAFSLVLHSVKQLFYNIAFKIHCLRKNHKKTEVYEIYIDEFEGVE